MNKKPQKATLFLLSSMTESGHEVMRRMGYSNARRVAIIETATVAEGRTQVGGTAEGYYKAIGTTPEIVDIKGWDGAELKKLVDSVDVLHIAGGNTFALLRAMKGADFDRVVREKAEKTPLIVVGESAGALVFGKDISYAASLDKVDGYESDDMSGLSWVDDCLLPHVGCKFWGIGEAIEEFLRQDENPDRYTPMREDEVLAIGPNGRENVFTNETEYGVNENDDLEP